jgi:predicted metal-binding protein
MNDILVSLLKNKVDEYKEIDASMIIYQAELLNNCKMNYCGKYNSNWMCPPAVSQNELVQDYLKYQKVFVFTKITHIEDAFDIDGMNEGRKKVEKIISFLQRKLLYKYDYKILGAGTCSRCSKCTYPYAPCRYPNLAIPGLEALGINVVELAKTCKIKYYNGLNTVTYFAAIYYNG